MRISAVDTLLFTVISSALYSRHTLLSRPLYSENYRVFFRYRKHPPGPWTKLIENFRETIKLVLLLLSLDSVSQCIDMIQP